MREARIFRRQLAASDHWREVNYFPILSDYRSVHELEQHYLYHPAWALRRVLEYRPDRHIDLGSKLDFALALSAVLPVTYFDHRVVPLKISNFEPKQADLMCLPLESNSVSSLSCMHVLEHVGLGRYGDPISFDGDARAIEEMKRVLAPGGVLLFVTPIADSPRVEFNAHRVYSYQLIKRLFAGIDLVEFSVEKDDGSFVEHAPLDCLRHQRYACGCFLFKKSR